MDSRMQSEVVSQGFQEMEDRQTQQVGQPYFHLMDSRMKSEVVTEVQQLS